jgi:arylsulfatase A-like enzyme
VPPNVIIVVVDALRADHVGCYGGAETPHIDRTAREGVQFADCFCTWNTTDQSLTSILTGRYPISHGIIHHGDAVEAGDVRTFQDSSAQLLSETLNQRGYRTLAVDWMGRWFRLGFDYYGYPPVSLARTMHLYLKYMMNHMEIFQCYTGGDQRSDGSLLDDVKGVLSTFLFSRELAMVQDAEYVTDAAMDLLDDAGDDPFFLLLHYWDVHTPYNCPRRFRQYWGNDPERRLLDRYSGAVRYVDEQLGRLQRWMERRGILDDTILVLTSDHGESLNEHEIYFDHHGLYEVNTHVPLIMRYPQRLPAGQQVEGFVQHVDLVPTLLALTGTEHDTERYDGESLMPTVESGRSERPFAYSEESYVQPKRAIRTDRYRYITASDGEGYCRYCHTVHGGVEELYDLGRDPDEQCNLAEKHPDLVRRLRGRLQEFVQALNRRHHADPAAEERSSGSDLLSPEEQDQLKKRFQSLGYHG